MKTKIEVERAGLCIFAYLPGTCTVMFEYQACTHGGWAKYNGFEANGRDVLANFDDANECLQDLAKSYEVVEL